MTNVTQNQEAITLEFRQKKQHTAPSHQLVMKALYDTVPSNARKPLQTMSDFCNAVTGKVVSMYVFLPFGTLLYHE